MTPGGDDWWQASDGRWYPPESHPDLAPQPPAASHKDRNLLVLAAVVVVGVVVAAVVLLVGGDDDGSVSVSAPTPEASPAAEPAPDVSPEPSSADEPSPEATSPPSTADPTATPPPEVAADDPAGDTCRYLGLDERGDMQVEVALTAAVEMTSDLAVEFALHDGEGVRFHTDTAFIVLVAPGERISVQAPTFTSPPPGLGSGSDAASCELLEVEALAPSPTIDEPGATDSCRYVGVDDFDEMQVEIVLTSAIDMTRDLAIDFALRHGDGARFHTDTAFVDLVAPGERLRVESDTFTTPPSGLEAESVSCEVLAIEALTLDESIEPPGATDSCRYIGVSDFDEMQVEISLTSPFTTASDLVVKFVLRDGDGVRFLTELAFPALVGPGEEVRLPVDTFTPPPTDIVEADVACEILGLGQL